MQDTRGILLSAALNCIDLAHSIAHICILMKLLDIRQEESEAVDTESVRKIKIFFVCRKYNKFSTNRSFSMQSVSLAF